MILFNVHSDFMSHFTDEKMEAFLQGHIASKRQSQNENLGLWNSRTCVFGA